MYQRIFFTLFIALLICSWTNIAISADKEDKWERASKTMVKGLKNGNDGLKQSIMQNIIRYSDKVDVDEALFDILKIYRDHENDGMRQLALITLYKMDNQWVIAFLERAIKFEKSDRIRKSICAILHECDRPVDVEDLYTTDFASYIAAKRSNNN
jgi:hypothetical protein